LYRKIHQIKSQETRLSQAIRRLLVEWYSPTAQAFIKQLANRNPTPSNHLHINPPEQPEGNPAEIDSGMPFDKNPYKLHLF
jgi:hypothetical protein